MDLILPASSEAGVFYDEPIPGMKSIKVGQLINRKIDTALGHVIYVVRDGRSVFYVGQSKRDVITRFHEHLQKPSRLGLIVQLNQPDSAHWDVDFYTLADCRQFVSQKSLFPMQAWEHFDMDMAEIAMIQHLHPIINQDFNPHPTPLPDHYKGHDVLSQPLAINAGKPEPTNPRIWLNRMSLSGWTFEKASAGDVSWHHPSGMIMRDADMEPYRNANKLPPLDRA